MTRLWRSLPGVLAALLVALAASGASTAPSLAGSGLVALKAGTIHLVEEGRVLEGGATILVKDGRILAVGTDVAVPPGAQVVDYGPDAVVVPGLVAAMSPFATGPPSARTADPGVRGVDGFDVFGTYAVALSGGVTAAYVTPAEGRLIAGQGGVVKLAGEPDERIVQPRAAIHGAIDASARSTPGFWEPPVPATVDVGIGYARPQLPRSTMGALVALDELLDAARGEPRRGFEDDYGPRAARELRELMDAGVPWRLAAVEPGEIRALVAFAKERGLNLIVDKADGADPVAEEIAAAGAAVVFRVPYAPNSGFQDRGKDPDARWPRFDVPAHLVDAGVRVAIVGSLPRDLLFAATLASRGGLDEAAALRAITLTPAELLGAADRLGSIRVGKDADFCVVNAPPLSGYASVLATWVGGEVAWSAHDSSATILEVEELHVGDGSVLRPGQLLLEGGRIAEVADRVSHPRGATVVRGRAAMPGIVDALGHLGLEGSRKVPATDYSLATIVGPGDTADRRVARHGITTVVLSPRGASKTGAPVMAYKPASTDGARQVIGDPVALRLQWSASKRLEAGDDVRELLAKAAAYRRKWIEYEKAMASWTPPPPEPPKEEDADEEEDDEEKDADEEEEDSKSKKKKKKDDEELESDPLTGQWTAEVAQGDEGVALKMRLHLIPGEGSGDVEGNLRCDAASATLVELEGYWNREEKVLALTGLGSRGWVSVAAKHEEGALAGELTVDGETFEFSAERTSKDWVVAGRRERPKPEKEEEPKAPKGKPKKPKVDAKLEPVRRAMEGKLTIVVHVNRSDEILACVAAFEEHGIQPVLFGADDANDVADEIAGRVRGVLLSPVVLRREADRGTDYVTPYADLQNAGVPVAFHSGAEEGAIELPLAAAYAVANGMSPTGALRALTADAAAMMAIDGRVGRLARGLDADVLLLDGSPLDPGTSVVRTWVDGEEVRP